MKRYLKTPEEVIDALRAGKVLTSDEEKSTWTMYNGVIVRKKKEKEYFGKWSIGNAIVDYFDVYVNEPEPLKLEVGKFYKRRDGKKVVVLGKNPNHSDCFSYRVMAMEYNSFAYWVTVAGQVSIGITNDEDLVAPWEE